MGCAVVVSCQVKKVGSGRDSGSDAADPNAEEHDERESESDRDSESESDRDSGSDSDSDSESESDGNDTIASKKGCPE